MCGSKVFCGDMETTGSLLPQEWREPSGQLHGDRGLQVYIYMNVVELSYRVKSESATDACFSMQLNDMGVLRSLFLKPGVDACLCECSDWSVSGLANLQPLHFDSSQQQCSRQWLRFPDNIWIVPFVMPGVLVLNLSRSEESVHSRIPFHLLCCDCEEPHAHTEKTSHLQKG